jgi:hypothetical protein
MGREGAVAGARVVLIAVTEAVAGVPTEVGNVAAGTVGAAVDKVPVLVTLGAAGGRVGAAVPRGTAGGNVAAGRVGMSVGEATDPGSETSTGARVGVMVPTGEAGERVAAGVETGAGGSVGGRDVGAAGTPVTGAVEGTVEGAAVAVTAAGWVDVAGGGRVAGRVGGGVTTTAGTAVGSGAAGERVGREASRGAGVGITGGPSATGGEAIASPALGASGFVRVAGTVGGSVALAAAGGGSPVAFVVTGGALVMAGGAGGMFVGVAIGKAWPEAPAPISTTPSPPVAIGSPSEISVKVGAGVERIVGPVSMELWAVATAGMVSLVASAALVSSFWPDSPSLPTSAASSSAASGSLSATSTPSDTPCEDGARAETPDVSFVLATGSVPLSDGARGGTSGAPAGPPGSVAFIPTAPVVLSGTEDDVPLAMSVAFRLAWPLAGLPFEDTAPSNPLPWTETSPDVAFPEGMCAADPFTAPVPFRLRGCVTESVED